MDKNKQDFLIRTIFLQFLICGLIFALLFSIDHFNISILESFKENFSKKLKENITTEEVKDAFKKIEDFAEEEFLITDFSETGLSAKVLGEGGEDEKIDNSEIKNVSYAKYNLNYKIYNPVIGGEVSSEFGERVHPINGTYGIHKGIDIALDSGEPIYAIYDGEVVEATYDIWNGNYIKIKHDNNILSVYCHCSKLFVKKGEVIRGGEVIALVGSTGQSTGPHIHFELRINEVSYNPAYALKDAKNAV